MTCEIVRYGMTVPPPGGNPSDLPRSSAAAEGNRARILVVEDDYLVGLTIEETLLEAGHEVLALVATGEEAVEEGVRLRPDLVLMDIRLAGPMCGIEAAVKLRAEGIPSLFASAHTDPGTKSSGEQADPVGWLAKPFTPSGLNAAVELALANLRAN